MSYYFKSIGKKADVVQTLDADKYVPDYIKAVLKKSIAAIPDPAPGAEDYPASNSVIVEAQGHDGGNHKMSVDAYNQATTPPPSA